MGATLSDHPIPTTATRPRTAYHYACPTCPASVTLFLKVREVGHRCPKKLDRWTTWVEVAGQ